jgi:hypothetical protein
MSWLLSPAAGTIDLTDLQDVNAPLPNDGDHLEWDNGTSMWINAPPPVGGLLSVQYRFSTSLVNADPGPGRFRYDTAVYATVTEIRIDDLTNPGVDISNLLTLITTDDRIYIQGETDSDEFAVWNVTGPSVDNGGWFTIPVTLQVGGTFLGNNDRVIFAFQVGGAASSTLQGAYDQSSTPPQITLNATPDAFTLDASVAGDIFTVRDVANVDLLNVATTGITFADAYSFPTADGTADQLLRTDGAGALTFRTINPQREFFETMGTQAFVFSDFFEPPAGLQVDGLQAISSGAGSSVSVPTAAYDFTNHPGVWGLNTGGTAAGRTFLLSEFLGGFHVGLNSGVIRFGCWYQSPAVASVALNRYVIRAGFSSISLPNTLLQAITFEAQDDQNGGRWQALCEDGVAETTVDTGVAVGTSTYFLLEFEINAAGTSVEFFIDSLSVATIATNIPSGAAFEHFVSLHIMKLTGTANRATYVDAYYLYQEITR